MGPIQNSKVRVTKPVHPDKSKKPSRGIAYIKNGETNLLVSKSGHVVNGAISLSMNVYDSNMEVSK